MTPASLKQWVEKIRGLAERDPESAHIEEDELRAKVLRAVALGHQDARELAQIALSTETIRFPRWCA